MTTFDLTHACNLHCVHCCRQNHRGTDLDAASWTKILRDFASHGVMYVFGGGEPLLYPYIAELIEEVRCHRPLDRKLVDRLWEGLSSYEDLAKFTRANGIAVTTNGLLLDSGTLGLLQEYGVTVWVSIDAASEAVAGRVRPSLDLESQLSRLRAARRVLPVHVNCVVSMLNVHEVTDIVDRLAAEDVNLVRFTPVRRIHEAFRNGLNLEHKAYFMAANRVIERFETDPPIGRTIVEFNVLRPQWVYAVQEGLFHCLTQRADVTGRIRLTVEHYRFGQIDRCAVDPFGNFTGCCNASSLPEFHLGNLLSTSLSELIEKDTVSPVFGIAPASCRSCQYVRVCAGGCRLVAYTVNGEIATPDPSCPFREEAPLHRHIGREPR